MEAVEDQVAVVAVVAVAAVVEVAEEATRGGTTTGLVGAGEVLADSPGQRNPTFNRTMGTKEA